MYNPYRRSLEIGISVKSIKVLKFHRVCDRLVNTSSTLNEQICNQLEEFCVGEVVFYCDPLIFIGMILRFRNLTSLSLVERNSEEIFKYIFERCTKLKKFSLRYQQQAANFKQMQQTFEHLKENCNDLNVIQLLVNHYAPGRTTTDDYGRTLFDCVSNMFPNVKINESELKDGNMHKIPHPNHKLWKICEKPY